MKFIKNIQKYARIHLVFKLNLDFGELEKERFDIIVDRRSFFEENFQILMKYCSSEQFKKLLVKFDGYDMTDFGKFHYVS